MKITIKTIRILFAILYLQLCNFSLLGAPTEATIEAYFLPRDKNDLNRRITSLLQNAQKEVLVAMYHLSDENIIDELISIKYKGVNVQIIVDQSLQNLNNFLIELINEKITPIVLPKKMNSKMHNKFIIIDQKFVITGSANLTLTKFDQHVDVFNADYFNNENILIINSEELAKKYRDAFLKINNKISKFYMNSIAHNSPEEILEWMHDIIIDLGQPHFTTLIEELKPNLNELQNNRITNYFKNSSLQSRKLSHPKITKAQKFFLQERNYYTRGMSKRDASELIEKIKHPFSAPQKGKSITYGQKLFLQKRNYATKELSRRIARRMINRISADEEYKKKWKHDKPLL